MLKLLKKLFKKQYTTVIIKRYSRNNLEISEYYYN